MASPGTLATATSRGKWFAFPHHRLIDREITDLVQRRVPERILVIETPPRHGKSEIVSHWTPAWHVARWPDKLVGLASYEARFAKSWGRKARSSFAEFAPGLCGLIPDPRKDAANEWGPKGRDGGMVTAGVGGPFTGRGFHLLCVDDPIKNSEDALSEVYRENLWNWWQSTAFTRLEPDGVAIVIQTRWHKDDLIGRLLHAAETGDSPPVRRLFLPAVAGEDDQLGRAPGAPLWPDQWPLSRLEETRKSMSRFWWLSLYQQVPSQHDDAEWPEEYFEDIWAEDWQWPDRFHLSTIAIDPSKGATDKSDYSAIAFVGYAGDTLWVDMDVERRPVPKIVEDAANMAVTYKCDNLAFESNGFQELLAPEYDRFVNQLGLPFPPAELLENHNINKKVRIRRLGGYLRSKRIKIRKNKGGMLTVEQMRDFPLADYDDGPDALEMAIRRLNIIAAEGLTDGIEEEELVL